MRPDSAPGISVQGAGLDIANGIYVRTAFKALGRVFQLFIGSTGSRGFAALTANVRKLTKLM